MRGVRGGGRGSGDQGASCEPREVGRELDPPTHLDSTACRVGARGSRAGRRQVPTHGLSTAPQEGLWGGEEEKAADFLEDGTRGGWGCSNGLTLTEFGFSNPHPTLDPPRPHPPSHRRQRGQACPARPEGGAARGGRDPGSEPRSRAGRKAASRAEPRRKAGSASGLGTRLKPRSVLAPPPKGP